MAQRVADWGYVVLAPNVFYRQGTAADLAPGGDMDRATAQFVFGHADHDRSMGPDAAALLGEALAAAGLKYSNEVYPGASHGYPMADTSAFHEEATDRPFRELRNLLDGTLKG